MGNCTQSQPEQTVPTDKDEPLMPEKRPESTRKSNSKKRTKSKKSNKNSRQEDYVVSETPHKTQNITSQPEQSSTDGALEHQTSNFTSFSPKKECKPERLIIVCFEAPDLNLYIWNQQGAGSNREFICSVATVGDDGGASYITDYTEQIRTCIDNSDNLPEFTKDTKYTLIDSATDSNAICGRQCSDFSIDVSGASSSSSSPSAYSGPGRCLIVTRALQLEFSVFSNNTGGSDGPLTPPSLWVYENETLESALCAYCSHFSTIPSGVEFVKYLTDESGAARNVLEIISSLEPVSKLNLGDGDQLYVRKNKSVDATLLRMRGMSMNGKEENRYDTMGKGDDIKLFVKSLSGRIIEIKVKMYFLVLDCKYLVWKQEGISVAEQKLEMDGRRLKNDEVLQNCGIGDGVELNLVL